MPEKGSAGAFHRMGLLPSLVTAVRKLGYNQPTPIQRKAIPVLLEGRDVVGMARTGSGKTAAFAIPLINKLKEHCAMVGSRALVLSPTRELAIQTSKTIGQLAKGTGLRVASLVGGEGLDEQFGILATNPDILVATPGRLLHLVAETRLSMSRMHFVVFDEADRLFEMGFQEQLTAILALIPVDNRQLALFSATMPQNLAEFAGAGLKQDAVFIRLDAEHKLSPDLKLEFFLVKSESRRAACLSILSKLCTSGDKLTIIFTATKHHVEYLHDLLSSHGFACSGVYGSMDQTARQESLDAFRYRRTPVLIVTDLAARGLDIPHLDNVINYDMPPTAKLFVHRVGRAARAGRCGTAFSICAADELPFYIDLLNFLSLNNNDSVCMESIPQETLDFHESKIGSLHAYSSGSLDASHKVMQNAYKHYHASRPPATSESYQAAKALLVTNVAVATRYALTASNEAAEQLKLAIRAYRPKRMHQLDVVVQGKKTGLPPPKASRKDAHDAHDFYMPYQPKDASLVAQERQYSIKNTLLRFSDRTMTEDPLDRKSRSKESSKLVVNGVQMPASFKDGHNKYDEWRRRTHVSLPRVGEQELPEHTGQALAAKKKRWFGKGKRSKKQ